jgi:hypothetical protein
MHAGVRYSGLYLRRSTAENAFRTCHRRGWDPTLGRRLGVWIIGVAIDPLQPAVTGEPQSGQRNGFLAASSRRIA